MNPEETQTGTLSELAQVRAQARAQAAPKKEDPPAQEETVETKPEETPPAAASAEEPAPAKASEEDEGEIRIGDKTFKTTAEAVKYAEQLAHDKEVAEAHAQGIQEALAVTRPQVEAKPEEDDFETRFYTNPKETLRQVEETATQKAVAKIKAEQSVEEQWRLFDDENPDLAGQRSISTLILQENWETIGKMTDIPKARKLLATKVRARFQEWADKAKPRTELPNKGGQVVSSGSQSVTPAAQTKKEEMPLDFAAQLRANRRR